MIFVVLDVKCNILHCNRIGYYGEDQARGIYGLRRDGENKATVKTQAATGANMALVIGLCKLCWFILAVFLLFLNFVQIIALNLTYARKM